MKNKIEGYGDEWIIPNRSVLDELAENYEFTDAGKELQKRGVNKIINKTNKAASCDYVEQNRRNTAINFVLMPSMEELTVFYQKSNTTILENFPKK